MLLLIKWFFVERCCVNVLSYCVKFENHAIEIALIRLTQWETRPNELGSMTARKGNICKTIKDHRKQCKAMQDARPYKAICEN